MDCEETFGWFIGLAEHSIGQIEGILERDTEDPILWLVRMEDDVMDFPIFEYSRRTEELEACIGRQLTRAEVDVLRNISDWREDINRLSKAWNGSEGKHERGIAEHRHWIFDALNKRLEGLDAAIEFLETF